MTVYSPPGDDRDRAEVEALVADRYLDALLADGDRRAFDAPAGAELDPELRAAVRTLRRAFVRVHPSFRFEERLAARLRDAARGRGAPGVVRTLPGATAPPAVLDPALAAIAAGELDPAADPMPATPHPLIIGGAMASAALSLVGVAWVAWRATHPAAAAPRSPMGRAARVAHDRRPDARSGPAFRALGRFS